MKRRRRDEAPEVRAAREWLRIVEREHRLTDAEHAAAQAGLPRERRRARARVTGPGGETGSVLAAMMAAPPCECRRFGGPPVFPPGGRGGVAGMQVRV